MRGLVTVAARGYLVVSLVSANTVLLARGSAAAVGVSMVLAVVWWFNAKTAARVDGWRAAVAYAVGSGLGTLPGMAAAG